MNNEPFKIIFQDQYLVVLNKIAKILVEPTSANEKHTLTTLLSEHAKHTVYPCHRLDRETTGLIIYAKDRGTQEKIMNQFRAGEVKKKYVAFVRGHLKSRKGTLRSNIIDQQGKEFGEKPKLAITAFHVLKEFADFSVVELIPFTGRTNQLRIQLADIGNPILGERKYAFGRDFKVKFPRLALHAVYLKFTHPVTNKPLVFNIILPQEMTNFLIPSHKNK